MRTVPLCGLGTVLTLSLLGAPAVASDGVSRSTRHALSPAAVGYSGNAVAGATTSVNSGLSLGPNMCGTGLCP